MHKERTAVEILIKARAGIVLAFDGENGLEKIKTDFVKTFEDYQQLVPHFDPSNVDMNLFSQYSAKEVTRKLVNCLQHIK